MSFIEAVNPKILSLDIEMPEKLLEIAKEKNYPSRKFRSFTSRKRRRKFRKRDKKIMLLFSNNDHIFNLSHGILPTTPIDNVKKTIEIVRNLMKPNNHIDIPKKKLGVLMVNLGTPEKTDFLICGNICGNFLVIKE